MDLTIFFGYNLWCNHCFLSQQNLSRTSVYLSQYDRTSNKNLVHLYQSGERDHLSYFDHGKDENINLYGSAEPSEFPYYNIDPEKLVLISALNDNTADQKDVQKFRNSLCDRPCADHIITDPSFNHQDFVQSTQAYKYFGSVVVELIEHCIDNIQQSINSELNH